MLLNVVDLGSNSFQWLVARTADGRVEPLHRQKTFPRLGLAVARSGEFLEADVERALDCIAELRRGVPREYANLETVAVATAAIRQSRNGQDFVHRVRERFGVHVEVLSGEEEAALSYRGALAGLQCETPTRHAVVDLGGGSTELAIGTLHGPENVLSVQKGLLAFGGAGIGERDAQRAALEVASELSQRLPAAPRGDERVVLACGIARTLVSLLRRLAPESLSPRSTPGVKGYVRTAQLEALLPLLGRLPPQELMALGVPEARSTLLGLGAAILHAVGKLLGAKELLVARGGLREGVALRHTGLKRVHLRARNASSPSWVGGPSEGATQVPFAIQ